MSTDESHASTTPRRRLLAGAPAWIITDGKAGMDVQAKGVADALGVTPEMKRVALRGIYKFTAPWGPADRQSRFGEPGSDFAPPWPKVAIATGRASIPYIRALKRKAGLQTFTVVLQDPKTGPGTADLIWVPQHDKRRGPNVITTLTAPHSFSPARFADLRAHTPAAIAALPGPRVAVILGGKNGVFKFTEADDARLAAALKSLAKLGASFMITPSRRTHERLVRAVDGATQSSPRILWTGEGENPYAQFLAHADLLVVTADSVNMCGEACSTGRPVYIFTPSEGSPKFSRFHKALRATGACRPLPAAFERLETWDYTPLDSAAIIAAEIERRWQNRQAFVKGG